MHASRGRHNSAWGQVYGGERTQVKAHIPAQAEVEQAEARAHGQVEARGHEESMSMVVVDKRGNTVRPSVRVVSMV